MLYRILVNARPLVGHEAVSKMKTRAAWVRILVIHEKTQGPFNFRESAELLRQSAFVVGPIDDGSVRSSSLIKFNTMLTYTSPSVYLQSCLERRHYGGLVPGS